MLPLGNHLFCTSQNQCDLNLLFRKFLPTYFLYKCNQNILLHFGLFCKASLLKYKLTQLLLGTFDIIGLGLLCIPSSGRTDCNETLIVQLVLFNFLREKNETLVKSWSSLVEGGEGSYLPNCQANLVIALNTLSLLFCKFINTTAYHLGRYEPTYI